MTMMECLIGLTEQVIVRDHLAQPISFQLALDHCDQGVAGDRIKLDALVQQDATSASVAPFSAS